MSQSMIQTVNSNNQSLTANSLIGLGTTINRYGCDCRQNGNGIEITGSNYFEIQTNVIVTPTAAGNVTVVMQRNGVAVPGAIATGSVATEGDSVTLPIDFIIRRPCCSNADIITFALVEAGTVNNITTQIKKL